MNIRQWYRGSKNQEGGLPQNNIAAFFSVRQLQGYSGNCMRILRDSDDAILDIGFDSGLVDTSAISTFCAGTVGYVERWYNQVDGTFATAFDLKTRKPTIYESGSVYLVNGNPAIDFTRDDNMLLDGIDWKSHFIVVKIDQIGGANYFGAQSVYRLFFAGTATGINGHGLFESNAIRISNSTENLNQNQHTFIRDTDFLLVDSNSIDEVINTYNSNINLQYDQIGYSVVNLSLRGKCQEIILYSDNRQSDKLIIESDIQNFYGIY